MAVSLVGGRVDDAALIERSWREPEEFAALFDRHAVDIHRYAARRLGSGAADDVMAETFLVAFQRRRRYDVTRPDAKPWLYGIATNLIRGHRRAEVRRWRALARELPAAGAEPEADRAAARLEARARRRELTGALARLPARQRDVLLLHAWAELGYEEIADALGVPVGTVRSRLHRARAAVRAAMDAEGETRWTS